MRSVLVVLLVACSSSSSPPPPKPAAPDPHNLGFEQLDGEAPKGWMSKTHKLVTDAKDKHGGARSLVVDGEGVALVSIDATPYRDKRVTLRGWVKTADSEGTALWLRADAGHDMVGFDNMGENAVRGTTGWQEIKAV